MDEVRLVGGSLVPLGSQNLLFSRVPIGLPRLFVVLKSEKRWKGPGWDDDTQEVVCLVVFHGVNLA